MEIGTRVQITDHCNHEMLGQTGEIVEIEHIDGDALFRVRFDAPACLDGVHEVDSDLYAAVAMRAL